MARTKHQFSPGPAAYRNLSKEIGKGSPKKSISYRLDDLDKIKKDKLVPGPGQYDDVPPTNINRNAPHYRIGTSKRHDPTKLIKTPGVDIDSGFYRPSQALTKNAIPNQSVFSQSVRKLHDEKSTPGVGMYEINEGAISRNGVIIGQRLPSA